MVKEEIADGNILSVVMDHHERLDGTGYPNNKYESEINPISRVLAIIDVYSALTLERADRYPLTAHKALEFLMNRTAKFDRETLIKLMNFLHIYPLHSIVQLSNKKKAQIIYVYKNTPCLPTVTEIYSKKSYHIPYDLSVSADYFVSWDKEEKHQLEWELFIEAIILKKEKEALDRFKELSFESLIDEVYADIVVPAMKELFDRGADPGQAEQIFLHWMREKTLTRV